MNDVIKEIGIFAAGAVIGIVSTRVYFQQKYKQEADEQIAEAKKFAEKQIAKAKEEKTVFASGFDDKPSLQEVIAKTDYNTISETTSEKQEEVSIENMSQNEHPEDDRPMDIHAITNDEFVYEMEEFEKIPLSFYLDDESLVDENEELANIDQTIGKDQYQILCAQHPDSYWVRNPHISTDFEIFSVERSYKKDILGEE